MNPTRRLAAILAADVAGYSAMMERDEEGTFARVRALRRDVIEPKLTEHRGRLIKTTGDGFLAEFGSPIAALKSAMSIQASQAGSDALQLRIGLNLGDVIIEDGDVYGEGVNVAARLEALAEPGGILVSDKIHREVEGKVEVTFEDRGEQHVKNIAKPVRAYSVLTGAASSGPSAVREARKPLQLPDKPSVAVLPFQNMSGDPEQEYFPDGIVEDIITALSRFKSLFVIARNSSFTYKGKPVDIKQVGRELGVRYVLEGSVRKSGERLRITGQLIDAATGAHLWADKFEGPSESVFELQDRITEQVVGMVYPAMQTAEIEKSLSKPAANASVYDLCLRALASLRKNSEEGCEAALQFCKRAAELDPSYPQAYNLAVACFSQRKFFGFSLGEDKVAEGKRYADLGVKYGQHDATTLAGVGTFYGYVLGELNIADGLYEQATNLNPNLADAWRARAYNNVWLGRYEAAISDAEKGIRLDPLSPRIFLAYEVMAVANIFLGRCEEALSWTAKSIIRRPDLPTPRLLAFMAHQQLGQTDEANRIAAQLRVATPTLTISSYLEYMARAKPEFVAEIVDSMRKAGIPE